MNKLVATLITTMAFVQVAGAEEATAVVQAAATGDYTKGIMAMAAALAISIAAFGGALAQAKAAVAAFEGIARNPAAQPKIFIPMIIALALIESLVIYALVIAFLIKP